MADLPPLPAVMSREFMMEYKTPPVYDTGDPSSMPLPILMGRMESWPDLIQNDFGQDPGR